MRKMLAVGMLGSALLLGSTGCSPDVACPAIGWINTVTVDTSAFGDTAFVQFCVDAGCSPRPDEGPTTSSDLQVPVQEDDGVFRVGMAAPEEAMIRVYDATGMLLHESDHDIAWTHSTGPCGGPSTAAPIIVTP